MREEPRGFEFLEHTADLAVRAWGPTLGAVFEEAARGLVASMVGAATVAEADEREVRVEAPDAATLLYRFLEEVRFLAQDEGFLPAAFAVEVRPGGLFARVRGEPYMPERHGHLHEVKAVTMHELRVESDPPGARYVVDI